jgi:hypothetical protein
MLLCASCTNQNQNQDPLYTLSGKPKPHIAVVPLIDHSENDLSWNVSEEITTCLEGRVSEKGNLLLDDSRKVLQITGRMSPEQNPFGENIQWMKSMFDTQYVSFMELLEHEEVPIYTANLDESPANLKIAVRLRVVDLRGDAPQVILQEILHSNHYVPKQFTKSMFGHVYWGHEVYSISPTGLAHGQLIKEIASRIEDYVLIHEAITNEI